jgi:hypothetical protein
MGKGKKVMAMGKRILKVLLTFYVLQHVSGLLTIHIIFPNGSVKGGGKRLRVFQWRHVPAQRRVGLHVAPQ